MRYSVAAMTVACLASTAESAHRSHPPLRRPPRVSLRPMAAGPSRFVDVAKGRDTGDGSQNAPWKTIAHALRRLTPGMTLYLRGGVYREQVVVALRGKAGRPITIRSYPGESAVIDAAFRQFFDSPASAWKPAETGAEGEYRSARRYRNLRNVMGWFGDSMIGLNTYYHAIDLRSARENVDRPVGSNPRKTDIKPLYCGPGLWYDSASGYIYARLSHTHLPKEAPNYGGETDPRKLPMIVAPFRAVPLTVDAARHIRFQDLVIRGGGYDTIVVRTAKHIEFDNVTVWCGSYGLRVFGTEKLRLTHCGLYGSCPPWLFRGDTSKRAYPGRPLRDITRLNTHANLVAESGREFSVFAHPVNDDWEIDHCEFTDAHDGPYLGGVGMKFHHNLVENMQDDGVYLSPMYPRHLYAGSGARIEIYQNVFRRCLTALAFGGPEDTRDKVYIYRNIIDLRRPVLTGRPTAQRATLGTSYGKLMGDHGGPPWPTMFIYHNTFVMRGPSRGANMATFTHVNSKRPRRVFNNVFLHLTRLPGYGRPDAKQGVVGDGNLFWSPAASPKTTGAFFARYRKSPLFKFSKATYSAGNGSHSLVADPQFAAVSVDAAKPNDYRPKNGSAVVNAGVAIRKEWPDPVRKSDAGKPDIGALPAGAAAFSVGRRR